MNASSVRARLLGSAALGLGLSMVAASPAQAACNVVGSDVVCDSNTTTLDSNFPANFPADRNFNFGAGVPELGLEIDAGVTVDGFGLALTDIGAPADATVTIVNNGAIQLNAGNTPTTGATQAALSVSASGSTNVNYSGTGSVTSLGNGNGIDFTMNGTGDLNADIGGNVTSGVGNNSTTGNGVYVFHLGTAGDVNVTTAAGTTIRADWVGVDLYGESATNSGDINLINSATILSLVGAPDTLNYGVIAQTFGTGSVTIINDGQIGDATDRIMQYGIGAVIHNAASSATASVTGSGDIFVENVGVVADNDGNGSIIIDYTGALDVSGAGGIGIYAESASGAITVAAASITSVGTGIWTASDTGSQAIDVSGPITAGVDGVDAVSTSGDIDVTGSGDISSGNYGIYSLTGGVGSIAIDYTGLVDTSSGTGTGISAQTASGTIAVTSGPITAGGVGIFTNSDTGSQTINVAGPIAAGGNGVELTAMSSDIAVTGVGDITSGGGYGLYAYTSATGSISVDYMGAIDTGGGSGVYAESDSGTVNVSVGAVGAGVNGVEIVSNTGAQTIVLGGVTTGTTGSGLHSDGSGARLVVINAAGVVTGGAQDILLTDVGDATVINYGIIGAVVGGTAVSSTAATTMLSNRGSGIINGALLLGGGTSNTFENVGIWNVANANFFGSSNDLVANAAGGTLNILAGAYFSGLETLTNAGTLNALSGLDFDAGDTVLTNSGIANVAGLFDFGNGTDSFANTAAGVVNLVGDTDLANVETFTNAGMLNLATYTLTGPALSFVNDGVVATGGDAGLVGFADFTNAGTVDLAAGTFTVPAGAFVNDGTILANQGLTTIVGQTDFANAGLIDLSNGVAGDVLTIASDFAGSGGSSLLLDVASGVADVLVINGAATGTTTLAVNAVGAPINSDGILVVDTGTSTVDAFVLGSTLGAGLVDFSLVREGEDFFLVSAPNASALEPLALINTGLDMWYQSADIYHGYAALKRSDLGTGRDRPGVWGQVYWGRDRYGDKGHQTLFGNDMVVDHHQRTERHGLQGGVDFSFAGAVMGATVGWQKAVSDIGGSPSKAHSRGVNIGGYMMVGSAKGFYAGLLAKYDHNRVRLDNPAFAGVGKISANSFGMEGELGYRLAIGSGMLNLGGGLAWVSGSVEDFATASIDYDYDRVKSVRGRLGARYEHRSGVYLDGQLFHEFKDHNSLALISGSEADIATSKGRGTWLRAELGYGKSGSAGPTAALWVNAGDTHGIGLKAGWRF